ncbi:MAG: ABC transporter substrate-binding protein, partial [Rhodococcus fascians]
GSEPATDDADTAATEPATTDDADTAATEPATDDADTAATEPATTDEPQPGGSMTFLWANSPPTFDPAKADAFTGPNYSIYMVNVYDALVRVDYATGEIIPRIAESLTSNEDASVWTVKLREGVTFSDGTPYDADAVIFNWDRMQQPELASPCAGTLEPFEYTALDELTIEVTLPSSLAAFPRVMMDCGSKVASPTAIEQFGDTFATSPETIVGAGPFSVTEWIEGDHVSYVRNPDFWDNPRPYLDELRIQTSPNNASTVDAILAGTAAAGLLSTFDDAFARAEDAGLETLYRLSAGGVGMFFNLNREPLDDVRVRQALILATDLDDMNEKGAGGNWPVIDTYFQEESPYFDPDLSQETNNLEKAQALIDEYLAEKGVDSIEIEMLNADTFAAINTAQAQQWDRLDGVTVPLRDITGTQFVEITSTADYWLAPSIGNCQDPECFFRRFHSQSSQNIQGYGSPEVDALIDEARGETDVERQAELYGEIVQKLFIDDPIGVLWYHLGTPAVFDSTVKGATMYDDSYPDLSTIWLEG